MLASKKFPGKAQVAIVSEAQASERPLIETAEDVGITWQMSSAFSGAQRSKQKQHSKYVCQCRSRDKQGELAHV
jgi:hypothetical protein